MVKENYIIVQLYRRLYRKTDMIDKLPLEFDSITGSRTVQLVKNNECKSQLIYAAIKNFN